MKDLGPILLLEDDLVDAMTVKRALQKIEVSNDLVHVKNGEEAFEYLNNPSNEKPSLVLLDLNMPVMNGIEFLKERYKTDEIRRIPVVVLTTSNDNHDKIESYNLSIAGYMLKPVDYDHFLKIIEIVIDYWSCSEFVE